MVSPRALPPGGACDMLGVVCGERGRMRHASACHDHESAKFEIPVREDKKHVTQASDTPTSQSAAARWTFYRRLGLLLRTRLDDEGVTPSLHDVSARTHGRVSVSELTELLAAGPTATVDPVACVLLAQAFDVDPDFFVTDEAVTNYIAGIRSDAAALQAAGEMSLQKLALAAVAGREISPVAANL